MDFKDYVKFANEHPTCYLATAEGDQPRVRPLGMWFADETGFYFQSQSVKAMCKQIQKNPKVEICYFSPADFKMMRVAGKAKMIEDMELRKKCYEERDVLKKMGVKGPEDPILAAFHVYTGEAYFWTGANSMKEAEIPRVKF